MDKEQQQQEKWIKQQSQTQKIQIQSQDNSIIGLFRIVVERKGGKGVEQQGEKIIVVNDVLSTSHDGLKRAHELRALRNRWKTHESNITHNFNLNSIIANTILSCQFPNLKSLTLYCLDIDNFEFITYLNTSKLETLSLAQTKITSFRSIMKADLRALTSINFRNVIAPAFSLQRVKLNTCMDKIILEYLHLSKVMMQDLSGLVKTQLEWISVLNVEAFRRIKQSKLIQQMLISRFTQQGDHGRYMQISVVGQQRFL